MAQHMLDIPLISPYNLYNEKIHKDVSGDGESALSKMLKPIAAKKHLVKWEYVDTMKYYLYPLEWLK